MSVHLSKTALEGLYALDICVFRDESFEKLFSHARSYSALVGADLEKLKPVTLYLDLYFAAVRGYKAGEHGISLINRAKARLYREIQYALVK